MAPESPETVKEISSDPNYPDVHARLAHQEHLRRQSGLQEGYGSDGNHTHEGE